jgi:4-amino-4-deoxy-L-arabinose transferase-like glycosyltransferase
MNATREASFRPIWRVTARSLFWIGVGALPLLVINRQTIGLFHDDGLYAIAAKALATGRGYRSLSLPGEPFQTKYPPLYPWLLSLVWRLAPEFPQNIFWLKALNCVFTAITAYATFRAATLLLVKRHMALLAALFTATSTGVLGFADYTLSDAPFLSLVACALWLAPIRGQRSDRRQELAVMGLVGAAILTRSVGVCLGAGVAFDRARQRRWRAALLHFAITLVTYAGWRVWTGLHWDPRAGKLLDYYQSYERSAFLYLASDPNLAWRIVAGNVRYAMNSLFLVLGPLWPAVWFLCVPLALLGSYRLRRDGAWFPLVFMGSYLAVVLAHPFVPHRYLIPIIPVLVVAILAGCRMGGELCRVAFGPRLASLTHVALAALSAGVLLLGSVLWVSWHIKPGERHVRGWYGIDLGYRFEGFQETFEWVRRNTSPQARLGTMFDPMYFLYTGRHAVRPWFHQPETYFYPYLATKPFVGDPHEVANELRALGVDYLLLDPPAGYAEGEAAMRMLQSVLELPDVRYELLFRSSDGKHAVYKLDVHALTRAPIENRAHSSRGPREGCSAVRAPRASRP